MTRTRLMLMIAFIAAFAAGSAATMVARPPIETTDERAKFFKELKLTEDQREQMRQIWSDAKERAREDFTEKKDAVRAERDEIIREMLGDSLYEQYKLIDDQYAAELRKLDNQRREIFTEAREKTKAVLTPAQLEKWEKHNPHRHRGRSGRRGEGDDRRGESSEGSDESDRGGGSVE